tara:strand:+ start:674 stop:1513 length:840 start_codon:yes stop_codon:yes gene_type:complete
MDKMESIKSTKNLLDVTNYKKTITQKTLYESMNIYISIAGQCVQYLLKNLKTTNKGYLNFIIKRGLATLQHIHNMIFMYTKNSNLLQHHLEKGYLYYVEFVSQIGEDTNSYIKLNSKDATLFVYKKTIFDINQEYRNNMTLTKTDKSYVSKMRKFTECYNMLFLNLIELQMDELVKANDKHKEYMKYNKDFDRLISISYNIFIKKNYDTFTKIIKDLSYILMNKKISASKYLKIYNLVANKYYKKDIEYKIFKKKIYQESEQDINHLTSLKYVNWLFSR